MTLFERICGKKWTPGNQTGFRGVEIGLLQNNCQPGSKCDFPSPSTPLQDPLLLSLLMPPPLSLSQDPACSLRFRLLVHRPELTLRSNPPTQTPGAPPSSLSLCSCGLTHKQVSCHTPNTCPKANSSSPARSLLPPQRRRSSGVQGAGREGTLLLSLPSKVSLAFAFPSSRLASGSCISQRVPPFLPSLLPSTSPL